MALLKCSFALDTLTCMDHAKIEALYALEPEEFRQQLRKNHYKKSDVFAECGDVYAQAAPANAKAIFKHGKKRMLRRDLPVGHIVSLVDFVSQWGLIPARVSQELKDHFAGQKYERNTYKVDKDLCDHVYGIVDRACKNEIQKGFVKLPSISNGLDQ